jgi:hypothetical protein
MLPTVETEKRPPAVRPIVFSSRAQADCDRGHPGEQDAGQAEEEDRGDHRIGARPRVPGYDRLEDVVVEKRCSQQADSAEGDDRREQLGCGDAVGQRSAGPVADRQPAEEDADECAPDEERVAEERCEESACGQFRTEERSARREDGDGDHVPAELHFRPFPAPHTSRPTSARRPRTDLTYGRRRGKRAAAHTP